jgi:hypothetical protein
MDQSLLRKILSLSFWGDRPAADEEESIGYLSLISREILRPENRDSE